MQYADFLSSSNKRKIYWARNYVSWPIFSSFRPNLSHLAFANWERKGKVFHHVTQNVDGLLIKAGCVRLTELHGTSYKVKCVNCDFKLTRESMQLLIESLNPNWLHTNIDSVNINPDNDVRLTDDQIKSFRVPDCPKCKKDLLKPEIGKLEIFENFTNFIISYLID
jgi:NAD-dependent deacetylase sirtuin 4